MLDLLRDLLPILISGYIALNVFRYRSNYLFTNLSGEKYVMSLTAWGIAVHISFLVSLVLKTKMGITFQINSSTRELLRFLFYISSGALLGSIVSDSNILDRIQSCSKKFKENDLPKTSNLSEELLLNGTLSDELLIFEMSNHKFYVAHVKEADIEDTIPYEEKGVYIKPLLSGSRLPTEKFVKYDVRYVSDNIFEAFQNFTSMNEQQIEELENQMLREIERIDVILLYQKNIVSIRKFNAALFNKFK